MVVYKLEEFSIPEAMRIVEVKNFPLVVTMDVHGKCQLKMIDEQSQKVLAHLRQ